MLAFKQMTVSKQVDLQLAGLALHGDCTTPPDSLNFRFKYFQICSVSDKDGWWFSSAPLHQMSGSSSILRVSVSLINVFHQFTVPL